MTLHPPSDSVNSSSPFTSRTAYAAAHVVAAPGGGNAPGAPAALDWDATLAFRRRLWSLGFGVADAMDTAQRGMGLDWAATSELIARSGAEAEAVGGLLACGAGTDHLPAGPAADLAAVRAGYEQQIEAVEAAGARVILMASRQLAATAASPEDYHQVYGALLRQTRQPVILHWLGTMFDPALDGYWAGPGADPDAAADSVLALIKEHADRIDGIKVSLLDADREIALRAALPAGVRLYTGDDFHYPELIRSGSDALLGVFDPIAVPAATALRALDAGDTERYQALLAPTVPLARHLFAAPTFHYKTGIVFLAWLAGHQDHFGMVAGAQSGRSAVHLLELHRLALAAEILPDEDLAAARLRQYCDLMGVR